MMHEQFLGRRRLLRLSKSVGAASALYLSGVGCSRIVGDRELPFGVDAPKLYQGLIAAYTGVLLTADRYGQAIAGAIHEINRFRQQLRAALPQLADDIDLAFCVLEWAPMVDGFWGRFTSIGLKEQRQFIATWLESSMDFKAEIAYGLRPLILLAWYEQPAVKAGLGIEPPLVPRQRQAAKGERNGTH